MELSACKNIEIAYKKIPKKRLTNTKQKQIIRANNNFVRIKKEIIEPAGLYDKLPNDIIENILIDYCGKGRRNIFFNSSSCKDCGVIHYNPRQYTGKKHEYSCEHLHRYCKKCDTSHPHYEEC